MTTFSFRAECAADVNQFQHACDAAQLAVRWMQFPDGQFPDVEVEIDADATLADLQQIARSATDGHIVLQTLRACALHDNPLTRDFNLH
ncbi:hypothetical protein GCM10027093_08480 [Paraburkholderia jirisanensis]